MVLCSTGVLLAQSPEKFNYQAVARDASGNVLAEQSLAFRLSILQGTITGPVVYSETHITTTNAYGQVTLSVGAGTPVVGVFDTISWGSQPHFLKSEMDATGGSSFAPMGTTQLLSVPYALYAKSSGSGISLTDTDGDTKIQVEESSDEDIIRFDVAGAEKLMVNHRGLVLPNTTDSLTGVIYKGTERLFHNFYPDLHNGNNTFIGQNSGNFTMTSGSPITPGYSPLKASYNTVIGSNGFVSNQTGANNSVLGYRALFHNTSGSSNAVVGFLAGEFNTSGSSNNFIGDKAGNKNTSGSNNTAIGASALGENKANSRSTAVGHQAMRNADNRESGRDTYNTAVGYEALKGSAAYSDNTGRYNTSVGDQSLYSNTIGDDNAALGNKALFYNLIGERNSAFGSMAAYKNTTGIRNTCIGYMAGLNNQTGNSNTIIGSEAAANNGNASYSFNSFLGYRAGYDVTNGSNNSLFGAYSGYEITTGSNNLLLGYNAGDNITTGSNNIVIGYDINPPSATANNQMVIGNSSTLYGDLINNYIGIGTTAPHAPLQLGNNTANRKIVLYEDANNDHQYFGFGINTAAVRYQVAGTDSDHIFYAGNGSSSSNELARIKGNGTLRVSSLSTNGPVYSNNNILTNTNPSDRNLKENIVPIGNSLDKVMALNPVTYTWKSNGASGIGFIAQEVEEVIPQLVNTNEDGTKGIYSLEMIPFLVKAIQELESKMNRQCEMIDQLQETIRLQNSKIDELNKTQ